MRDISKHTFEFPKQYSEKTMAGKLAGIKVALAHPGCSQRFMFVPPLQKENPDNNNTALNCSFKNIL